MVRGDLEGEEIHPPWIILQAPHHIIKGPIYSHQPPKLRLSRSPPQGVQGWDVVRFHVILVPIFALGEGPFVIDDAESTEHLVYQNIWDTFFWWLVDCRVLHLHD